MILGQGRTIIDGMEQVVISENMVTIAAGCVHIMILDTDMDVIDVQIGEEISLEDKRIFPL